MPAEDAVPPSVGFAAELFGRHSHAAFEILAEERRIGEIEFVGDLLNGELVIGFEQIFRMHDDRVVDPPRRAVARYGPYYRREVFGRHADLVGVVPDFALADVVLRDQKEKLAEHALLPRLGAHGQRFAVLIDVEDFVVEHHRHVEGDLVAVGVAVPFEFTEHAAVFEHPPESRIVERDTGMVFDVEEQRGRRRDLHFACDVDLGDDAVGLEIVAVVVELHEHSGEEDAQVALLDVAAVLVERDAAFPSQADTEPSGIQLVRQIVGFGEFHRGTREMQQPERNGVRPFGILLRSHWNLLEDFFHNNVEFRQK